MSRRFLLFWERRAEKEEEFGGQAEGGRHEKSNSASTSRSSTSRASDIRQCKVFKIDHISYYSNCKTISSFQELSKLFDFDNPS
jgi:hypothetical protein